MASDFATQPFTFKIGLAFNFEMKDKVQIDTRENGKSWKRLAHRQLKWPKSTQNMKVIDRFMTYWLAWVERHGTICCRFSGELWMKFYTFKIKINILFSIFVLWKSHIFLFVSFFVYKIFELYSLRNATESLTACCSDSYGTPYLCYFQCFWSLEGPCDKQNLTFVVS